MRKLGQPKILLAVLCSAIAFNAHASFWDNFFGRNTGDDGNPNTVGNAAAAAARSSKIGAAKQSVSSSGNQSGMSRQQLANLLSVSVVNNTNTILASAVLKDNKTGKVLYTSTKGRTCAVDDVCRLRVNRKVLTKDTTFFFYDTNNRLTSAYMAKDAPAANAMGYDIDVSMSSLGVYVLSRIQTVNPKISYDRIDRDIITTTLQATPYEELADYYLDLLGSSKDDSKVIAGLAAQFAKNKSVPANPKSTRLAKLKAQKVAVRSSGRAPASYTSVKSGKYSLQSSSTQQETLCSTGVRTGFDIASKVPIPYASNVADIASYILGKTCGEDNSAMADKFSKLSSQMQTLQTSMDTVATQLTSVEQNQFKIDAIKYNTDNQKDLVDINTWVVDYSALLALNGPDGKPRNSLSELIDSYGGISNAIKNPDLDLKLSALYSSAGKMRTALNNVGSTDTISNFVSDMKSICGNPDKIYDGVFLTRSWCDLAITNFYARNAVLSVKLRYAYADVNKVYDKDTRTEVKRAASWSTIPVGEFDQLDAKINLVSPQTIFFNMIEPTDSVVTTVNNLKKVGFTIDEWYPDKDKRYLVVEESAVARGTTIKSKYAYQEPTRNSSGLTYNDNVEINSRVVNVMGVPVPERFFTSKGNDGKVIERNNYGANEAFPWSSSSVIADIGTSNSDFSNAIAVAEFKFPAAGNTAIYADGFQPANTFNSGRMYLQSNNGSTTQQTYDGKAFQRQIFTKSNSAYSVSTTAYRDYKLIGGGEYFTYIRYTAADGYSWVWAMRTWLEPYTAFSAAATPGYRINGAPQCMTNDCVAIDTGSKLEKLDFWKGPNIEWTYETVQDHLVFNLKETK